MQTKKNKNMKQLLSLFLFLLPCLAWAQYPSNGNQKITLGEQTTADGLIYRGVATDTTLTAKSDTAAYFVLDTVNINLYTYKASATGRKWRQLGADTAAIAYVNTYGPQTVNGAKTFSSTLNANAALKVKALSGAGAVYLLGNSSGISQFYFFDQTESTLYEYMEGGPDLFSFVAVGNRDIGFITNGGTRIYVRGNGSVGIGTTSPQSGYRLHVVDSVYVGGNVSASAYTTRSDYNLKDDIFELKYGLNDILQLKPVEYTYKSNGSKQLGFIAQDIGTILPEVVSFEESMSVNYQAIIPILTKAIQEQQALIKALEQRIINLENK
jgi:hypothetical protein